MLRDLDIKYEESSWIIVSQYFWQRNQADHQTAYSVTFASFLLLWGRVSDLYSAKPVFAYGFLGE
jgi:MFS family permease